MGYIPRSHKQLDMIDHLSTLKKEGNPTIYGNIDGPWRHYAIGNKSNREWEILHDLTHIWSHLKKKKKNTHGKRAHTFSSKSPVWVMGN